MSIDQITEFFGWCSIINIGLLMFSSIAVILLKGPISKIHGRLMGIHESELPQLYFRFLAYYKTAVLVFNVVPYIALKIMA